MTMKTKKSSSKIPTLIHDEVEDVDVASEFETDSEDDDSDAELQKAFEAGTLKPGLNVLVPTKVRNIVNNLTGLKEKYADLKNDLDWIERLDMINKPVEQSADLRAKYGDIGLKINKDGVVSGAEKSDAAQHDFKREMLFYRQAQAAVLEGISRLKRMGIKTRRPDDYFAEMVKTDVHMKKVQENLNSKKESMEKSERAKKMREMKKMGKQIQTQVIQKRNLDKKEMLNKIKNYQKGKTRNLDLEEVSSSMKNKRGKNNDKAMRIKQKRDYKNKTYGYGGKKRGMKRNDKDSHGADFLGLAHKKKGAKAGKTSRPGKTRRQNIKKGKK